MRRLLFITILAVTAGSPMAPVARASDYKGTTAASGVLEARITNGTLTAFSTRTGSLQTCGGEPTMGAGTDAVDLVYSGPPVALVGGKFHLEGTTATVWGGTFTWSADGTLSLDGREITGTATAGGDVPGAQGCTGTWPFDAIVPPRRANLSVRRKFDSVPDNRRFNPSVRFNVARGVIRQLTAQVGVECPDGGTLPADLDTMAYRLDPIRMDRDGRFRIASAVLDTYGVVNRFVLTGRVKGQTASGTLRSSRIEEVRGRFNTCTRKAVWRSQTASAVAGTGTAAYYELDPYRYGRPGSWRYYLAVKVTSCVHANRARVSIVGGPVRTTTCRGRVLLGPLAPKRSYTVNVTALKTRRGRVIRRGVTFPVQVYLPGDDGDWVRIGRG